MSTADPTPGDDAVQIPDNDRSFLEEQAPVQVDPDAVAANTAIEADGDEPGSDADAARS